MPGLMCTLRHHRVSSETLMSEGQWVDCTSVGNELENPSSVFKL